MADAGTFLLSLLATAWLHALVLCAVAWLAERAGLVRDLPAREALWRAALLLPLLSATIAVGVDRGALRLAPATLLPATVETRATPAPAAGDPRSPSAVAAATPAAAPTVERDATSAQLIAPGRGEVALAASLAALADDPRWPLAVALAWLGLGAAGGLLALRGLLRLRRRLRASPPPVDPALAHSAAWIARRAGLRRVALAQDAALGSPVAVAPDLIGVPAWSACALTHAQRTAMLAHEVAHLARRDPQWRIATRAAAGLLPTPLSSLALRRLDDLAELQCDTWAAHVTGDPRALAECLAECLAHGRGRSTPVFAVPMAAAQSPLVERVRRLLEEHAMPSPAISLPRRIAIIALLGGVAAATPHLVFGDSPPPTAAPPVESPVAPAAPAAQAAAAAQPLPPAPAEPPAPPEPPALPEPPYPPAPLRGTTAVLEMPFFGTTTTVSLRGGGYGLDAKARGDFSFTAAEDALATLDGWLEIEEQFEGTTRSARFERVDGRIVARFEVDGEAVADDAAARAWLKRAIPAFLRATGIDAERRVARILAGGGATAVLDETARIGSSHVRATYIGHLAEQATLDAADQDRAIELAAAIDGDYERRQALEAVLEHEALAAEQQSALHRAAADIESAYERRVLLEAAVPALRAVPGAAAGWIAALDGIESDYEHRVALESLAATIQLDADGLSRAIASTADIDSDYERRVALAALAPQVGRVSGLAEAYARAAAGIESAYEAREAMVALVAHLKPDAADYGALIDAIAGIDSDYEARVALVEIAERMPNDAALIERYRAAARRLDSSHERSEAEQALDRFYET